MKRLIVYVHGKGGSAAEAEHYKPLFPGCEVTGFDYESRNPREAVDEFPKFFESTKKNYGSVTLIANSIGAFFSLCALSAKSVDNALLVSPVVNMEKLICDMMEQAKVTEEELARRKEIPTESGETLSYDYLCYVREHPIVWNVPTCILYGKNDVLTSVETVSEFAERVGAELTVMEDGEHWFHTEKQMQFLDRWITRCDGKFAI
ncbi:MAG: alpha/beta hydrolase [Christensenellales bacterium]